MKLTLTALTTLSLFLLFSVESVADRLSKRKEIVVCNTNDSGPGSLRAAIEEANATDERTHIVFHLKKNDPGYNCETKKWTIKSESGIRVTAKNTLVDGYSQRGSHPNTNPAGEPSNACIKIVVETPPLVSAATAKALLEYVTVKVIASAKKLFAATAEAPAESPIALSLEGETTIRGIIGLGIVS